MLADAPDFSVVITTYNRPKALPVVLEALAQQEFPRDRFEVVVVDDGSDVAVQPIVDGFASRLQVQSLRQPNGGPAAGRNLGIRHAKGRFIAFTDDDCAPTVNWLAALARAFDQHPGCMIGGRMVNGFGDVSCSEAAQTITDCVYRYYNRNQVDSRFFASNNMACPAAQLRRLGSFDAGFRIAAEDRNLCERWRQAGYRLVFAPDAVVTHFHRLDLRSFWKMYFAYGRGAARFHQVRSLTGSSRFGEHFRFYADWKNWLRPFREVSGERAIELAGLLMVWQFANSAGFFYEILRHGFSVKIRPAGSPERIEPRGETHF